MTAIKRVLSDGYRVFFLAAGLYAVFAIAVWELWLGGQLALELPFSVPASLWHAHEMIFGYASAALAGFFLTAVPNWTGTKAAPIRFIAPMALLWLAGRIAIWFSGDLPAGFVAAIDLAFLPLLATKIAEQLIKRPKPQNVVFLGFLTLIWIANLLVHLGWMGIVPSGLDTGLIVGLLGLCAMIAVLGGRVTPAFTRNAMKRAGVPEADWPRTHAFVERPAVLATVALPVAVLAGTPPGFLGGCAILAGALQFVRLAFWRPLWTLKQPILWALHLGIAMLGAGLVLFGLSQIGIGSELAALHVLGIGCVGGMTIAVMSRAILGHSGRALVAPGPVAIAYGLIALSAILRWLGSDLSSGFYGPMMLAAGLLWILAFAMFIVTLWPIIVNPRQPN